MTDKDAPDPLLEWNRLNIENAEQGFVSALYISMAHTGPIVDKFSLWLLAGTGASGALLISQINTVLPQLTLRGFRACLLFLVISAIFGFIAKYKSLRCQIQTEMQIKLNEILVDVLNKHGSSEDKIQEIAEIRGIKLQTEINFTNIMTEYCRPFPFWVKLLIDRQIRKHEGNRQISYQIMAKTYFSQLRFTFFQAGSFLAFLCAGAWYARAI